MDLLAASTGALKGGSDADDSAYAAIQGRITDLTSQRDALASEMKAMLDAATFGNRPIDQRHAEKLIDRAGELLERARRLAGDRGHRDHDGRDRD